ncbi:MAG: lysylphosphatidylglycerol synthase transmembrane domain-containing protein [Chloroflexota bacterium]
MRRTIFLVASLVVSVFFLWVALRGVDFQQVLKSIQQAEIGWIIASFLGITAGLWLRGVRWYFLLDFKPPLLKTCHILNLGFLLNLLPFRIGEVARSLLITREGVPVVTAATSVVLERLIDTLLVVILLVFSITRIPNTPPEIIKPTIVFGAAVVFAFAVMVFFARFPIIGHRVLAFIERVFPFLKRLGMEKLFDQLLVGLKPLTHLKSALYALAWTLIGWAASFFTLYALVRALNITSADGSALDESSRILLTLLGLALASLGNAVPISVAGIGPFEATILLAGQTIGIPKESAISLGFLFHGINIVGYAVWGIVGLLATGVSLGDVMNTGRKVETPESA